MLYFASPAYLWLLLLFPVIPVVYGILRALRARRVRRFGAMPNADVLTALTLEEGGACAGAEPHT